MASQHVKGAARRGPAAARTDAAAAAAVASISDVRGCAYCRDAPPQVATTVCAAPGPHGAW
jgi:hypothetical protein